MRFRHEIRRLAQRFGVDIVRYPLHDPIARTAKLLTHHGITCVIDVGANDGGFAAAIRGHGYAGRIISFEPLQQPFSALRRRARDDGHWDVHRCAIGACSREVTINVAGNDGLSSSILPMLDSHIAVAPTSRYIGIESVQQQRLDVVLPGLGVDTHCRTFLKVDVQGYEHQVLDGAEDLFAAGLIAGMQLELSLTPLYDGAMTYREGLERAERLGMTLMGVDPVLADPDSGRLLQVDTIFFAA